jgi:ribonuclease P protein component
MLPKSERLKNSREFSITYSFKKSVANSLLILYVGRKKASAEIPAKVGFVVGKKIHKRANKRNRAKRLMREAYRNLRKTEDFRAKDYEYMIFLPKPAILEANYHQVYEAMQDCFKKAVKKFENSNVNQTNS